ncbi:hypothetical protein SteCoe_19501 [Stentor coeruleus]|uniref:Uncharacterized protein n=1 Tax=Stentor coeruleus TaxID=5963 RepID=A0A1R2BU71_9CILI|nr:hypothetical protein SteCoe_19501 [Stentor coeruleus]
MEIDPNLKFLATIQSNAFQRLLTIKSKINPNRTSQEIEVPIVKPSIPKSPQSTLNNAPCFTSNKAFSSAFLGIRRISVQPQFANSIERANSIIDEKYLEPDKKRQSLKIDIEKLSNNIKSLQNDIGPRSQTPSLSKVTCPSPLCLESENSSPETEILDTKSPENENEIHGDKSLTTMSHLIQNSSVDRGKCTNTEFLYKQLDIERKNAKYFEEVYNKEVCYSKNLEKDLESALSEIEVLKSSSDIQKTRLLNEIKTLKTQNLDLTSQLRHHQLDSLQYNYNTLLKKSATKISEHALEEMEKSDLLDKFYSIKKECSHLSKQLLHKADELFEKSTEIKQLNNQKSEMYKELNQLKEQATEMCYLKEHVAYLLNLIQTMRIELTNLAEKYKEGMKLKEGSNSEEFINRINNIANKAKTEVECITDRSKNSQPFKWINDKNKSSLIQTIKKSIFDFIKT